jgi:hypothetical protein
MILSKIYIGTKVQGFCKSLQVSLQPILLNYSKAEFSKQEVRTAITWHS